MSARPVAACLLSAAWAGCGGGEPPTPAVTAAEHRADVARDPYALTCGDLAAQPRSSTNQRLVIRAEFELAREPALGDRVAAMTLNRVGRSVYWALTEVCKGREAAYRPAHEAVAAVARGRYLVQPRPDSWSEPERWWRGGEED